MGTSASRRAAPPSRAATAPAGCCAPTAGGGSRARPRPLTSMSGAVELLESGRLGQLTPEQVRLLEMLGKGMQMMLSLLDDASARAKSAQQTDARGSATA